MLAFSNDYYGMIFRATQSVELFCAYIKSSPLGFPMLVLYALFYISKNSQVK